MNGKDLAYLIIAQQQAQKTKSAASPAALPPVTVVKLTPPPVIVPAKTEKVVATTGKKTFYNIISTDISTPSDPTVPFISIPSAGSITFLSIASLTQYASVQVVIDGQPFFRGNFADFQSMDYAYYDPQDGTYRIEFYNRKFSKSFLVYIDAGITVSKLVNQYSLTVA